MICFCHPLQQSAAEDKRPNCCCSVNASEVLLVALQNILDSGSHIFANSPENLQHIVATIAVPQKRDCSAVIVGSIKQSRETKAHWQQTLELVGRVK